MSELESELTEERPSAEIASEEAFRLSDEVRRLAYPVAAYRVSLEGEEPDEQILQTFGEIEGNMAYTGMDDAINDLAFRVRRLEEQHERLLAAAKKVRHAKFGEFKDAKEELDAALAMCDV